MSSETVFAEENTGNDKPKYAPNEIIVKFKKEAADTLEREITVKEKAAPAGIKISASTDNLNKKHKVKTIEPIFKKFKKDKAKLEALKTKDRKRLTKKEKHLLKRLNRAPKDAKVPDLDRIYKLELEEGQSVEEAVAEYSKDPNVEYAEPNYIVEICLTPLPTLPYVPNDYYIKDGTNWRRASWGQTYPDVWGLQKIQAIEAWNTFDTNHNGVFDAGETKPGEGVIVAVIDTGVDYNHEDLAANMWTNADEIPGNGIDDDGNGKIDDMRGWDFVYADNNPMDGKGHGTHVSGTIAGVINNAVGVAGVAPNAKIMAVKGLDDAGKGYDTTLADCVYYAVDNGADIICNSWRGEGTSQVLTGAFHYAYSQGCVAIAAAGNDYRDVSNFRPANIDTVIAVAATSYNDQKASFSNWGTKVDVAAPGVEILSLRAEGTDMYVENTGYIPLSRCVPAGDSNAKYYRANGTSMACPHVAGLAALISSLNPTFTSEEIRSVLKMTSDPTTQGSYYFGQGRINAFEALNITAPPPVVKLTTTGTVNGKINIEGTAKGVNFASYSLYYGKGLNPTTWNLLTTSTTAVDNGVLCADFDTRQLDEGDNILKLVVAVVSSTRTIEARGHIIVTVLPPPLPPSELNAVAVSNKQINLSWQDNSDNETGFIIERGVQDGSIVFNPMATVPPNSTSYSDINDNFIPGTTYYYRVCAYNDAGNSPYSNIASVLIEDAPPRVTIILPKDGSTHYTFSILVTGTVSDDVSRITSVLINGNTVPVSEGSFSYVFSGLTAGENTITVTAQDGTGNISTASATITYIPSTEVYPGESVQTAIDDPGSLPVIYVHDGAYTEDIYMKTGKALIGEPGLKTIIKGRIIFKEADTSIQTFTIEYPEQIFIDFTSEDGYYQNLKVLADGAVTAINSEIAVKGCLIKPDPAIFGANKFGKGIQVWNLYGNPDITPLIENCEISNTDTGIYLYSQDFGGAILGEIKNNMLDNNKYGITLRMHKEKPLIQDNEITNSIHGIHINYEDGALLQERLNNIVNNTFSGNADDIWCDELGE